MSQAKLVFIVCDILGIPMTFLGIWFNIDNIKSAIIAILSIAYLSMRGYFFMVEKKQKVREKEIDIAKEEIELWNMQQDKIDRINNPKKSA